MDTNSSFYLNILDTLGCNICAFNKDGYLLYFNKSFGETYLLNPQKMENKHFKVLEDSEYGRISSVPLVIQTHETISIQRKSLRYGTILITTTPIFDENNQLELIIETIQSNLKQEKPTMAKNMDSQDLQGMVLTSNALKNIVETISRISNFDSTILITGESGTGKSMLAKYIHMKSKRKNAPFIIINCATIPENLIESELFGYAAGAFTGATRGGKMGMVEIADKGTLFLDEIGLLPLNVQAKFLQLIQDKTYTPVGSLEVKKVDIRIISATNINLETQIKNKNFREDLYYRLRVIEFELPPLRERMDDIDALIDYFLTQYNERYDVMKTISAKAREALKSYKWTGNIRELQYVIERLIVTSATDHITFKDIPFNTEIIEAEKVQSFEVSNFDTTVEQFEKAILENAYRKYPSTYKMAHALGLSQTKASRLMRKYNINEAKLE